MSGLAEPRFPYRRTADKPDWTLIEFRSEFSADSFLGWLRLDSICDHPDGLRIDGSPKALEDTLGRSARQRLPRASWLGKSAGTCQSDFNADKGDIPGIHSVDWTFTNPEKAVRAARATFEAMILFRRDPGERYLPISESDEARWHAMLPQIRALAEADSVESKKNWIRIHAPEVEQEIPWADLTLDNRK
mgnify:CR=1 FL=1